jgi:type II secretory pathway component PulF
MDDDDVTDTVRPESTRESRLSGLFSAACVHLFLWGMLCVLLHEYVPRMKAVFSDTGVAVSVATRAVIHLSDLVVDYRSLVVPLVCAIVIIADSLTVLLSSTSRRRRIFLVLLTIPPIILLAVSWYFPYHSVSVAMEALG